MMSESIEVTGSAVSVTGTSESMSHPCASRHGTPPILDQIVALGTFPEAEVVFFASRL